MKKILCLLVGAIILYSCNGISYVAERQIQNTGLDFTKGKWLINEVDCPKYSKIHMKIIKKDFSSIFLINFIGYLIYLLNRLSLLLNF